MNEFPHDIDLETCWDKAASGKINPPPPSDQLIAELQASLGDCLPEREVQP